MATRTRLTVDAAALNALVERFSETARFGENRSRRVRRMLDMASEILVGEIRTSILASYEANTKGFSVRTGALARSFRKVSWTRGTEAVIGAESELVYARIQDEGGIIKPRVRQHLAVPLVQLPAGKWPRHFKKGELFPIKREGKSTLLARKVGKTGKIKPVFVLKKSVKLPPKHYLRAGVQHALPVIRDVWARELRGTLDGN